MQRKPGTPCVRRRRPSRRRPDERLRAMSVLEVVNDDMPFLVDSVMGELADRGLDVHLVLHPIFTVERDPGGRLLAFASGAARRSRSGTRKLHPCPFRADRRRDAPRRQSLRAIEAALADVQLSVQDWRAMLDRVGEVIAELKASPPPLPVGEIAEAIQFLQWLTNDNFTFLGIAQLSVLGQRRLARPGVRERPRHPARARRARACSAGTSRS